ncbi:MAG: hypothetical protein RIS64_2146 [Bacteroidota bacterium]
MTKKTLMRNYFFYTCLWVILLQATLLTAQPINDNCANAIEIPRQANWCDHFNNNGATPSGFSPASCFTSAGNDLWYKFTAIGSEVNVTVIGAITGTAFTLIRPEIALYYGNCSSFSEFRCGSESDNTTEIIRGGLLIGETYYIRIQGRNLATGSFRLCVSNYNPPAFPSADCPTAAVLCDKSPFTLRLLTGGGVNNQEMQDAPCFFTSNNTPQSPTHTVETDATWFKWTCLTSGTLAFKLTPLNTDDDIDFAVYELPNGMNSCVNKILLRCMASGAIDENGSYTSAAALRCHGATGLSLTATDISEPSGCYSYISHDNFVRAIDMVAGRSYALAINNFSAGGNGFAIEFDGTGTFVGPEPRIITDRPDKRLCLGENMVISDGSTFALGSITQRFWNFGKDASLDTTRGTGPFNVYYKTPGWKTIALTVTSDRGCVVTTILDSILVRGFSYDTATRSPTCANAVNGMVRARVTACGRAPIAYSWNGGVFVDGRDSLTGIQRGNYQVVVSDASRRYFDTIRFVLTASGVPLDSPQTRITAVHCFGNANGMIELTPRNGTAPYQYDWNDGRGLVSSRSNSNLRAGTYPVRMVDALQCVGNFTIRVTEPPRLTGVIQKTDAVCFNKPTGTATITAAGGTTPYIYRWSNGLLETSVFNLMAGTHRVTVTDNQNCDTIIGIVINQPNLIRNVRQDSICRGDTVKINNHFYTNVGTYLDTLRTSIGCDSVLTTQIVLRALPVSLQKNICFGESVAIGDTILKTTGIFTRFLRAQRGCDTMLTLNLNVGTQLNLAAKVTNSCIGDSTGALLNQTTGGFPPYHCVWQPSGATTLSLSNLAVGNYTMQLIDNQRCTSSKIFNVAQAVKPDYSIKGKMPCTNQSTGYLQLTAAAKDNLEWSFNQTSYVKELIINGLQPRVYDVWVRDTNRCVYKQQINLQPANPIAIQLPRDTILKWGDSLKIIPIAHSLDSIRSWRWQPPLFLSCDKCPQPTATPNRSIEYQLVIENSEGCQATAKILIEIDRDEKIYIPNVFSPNGDGVNDFLTIFGRNIEKIELFQIYSRWGELVFERKDFDANHLELGWDGMLQGRVVPPSVFAYYAVIRWKGGETAVFKGDVTLTR